MKKFKVAFASGSRADYGIVRQYIKKLNNDERIDFSLLLTGALLDPKYGRALDIVEEDGFSIAHKCYVSNKTEKLSDTLEIMAEVLKDFASYFEDNSFDLLIVLGDRYEIYSISVAAAMTRIPILHIHGGEVTIANYDEFIRHSITKMSKFHFTSTEEYRRRVIQLGEDPKSVFYLGALGAENALTIDENNVPPLLNDVNDVFTILFHPETLSEKKPEEQVVILLDSIRKYSDKYRFFFIGSNADTHADVIDSRIREFVKQNKENCLYCSNLHPDAYHFLLSKSIAIIGNSSSGIIEAPSLGCFTINIGDRQTGRVKGNSIIDVDCEECEITKAVDWCINNKGKIKFNLPYYKKNTAQLYYEETISILNNNTGKDLKLFYDIDM